MGSVCCVPCRSSTSSAANRPGYDVLPPSSPHVGWTVEESLSPLHSFLSPVSSSSLQHYEVHHHERQGSADPSRTSSHWRNASDGNSEIAVMGAFHRRQPELHDDEDDDDDSVSSRGSSPSSCGTSCTTHMDANTVDFSSTGSFSNVAFLAKESTTSGSSSLESKRKHFISSFKDRTLSASFNGGLSAFSKFRSMGFFHKHNRNVGEGSSEEGDWQSAMHKPHKSMSNKGWSMSSFSQHRASSQKDFNKPGFEELMLSSEKIQVASPQSFENCSSQKCSICSRLLIQRSPWSTQRIMLVNVDLPVVGVLVCGHVFHADCLEKEVPESLKHDPSCPECERQRSHAGRFSRLPVLGTLKAAREPILNRLSKIAPQIWRAPSRIAEVSPSAENVEEGSMGTLVSFRERGSLQKSMTKKLLSSQTKAIKDPVSCSKKFSQVSPASHL